MILRLAAAAALLFGAALVLYYLHDLDKGPFASPQGRHMRAMKDRTGAAPAAYTAYSFAELAALPRDRPIAEYAPIETRAASIDGYVWKMFRARDGDYHLDLAPMPGDSTTPFRYYAVAEITPQWHLSAPAWRFERLAAAFRPRWGAGTWDGPPRRMRLSGWLMYDHEHATPPPGDPYPELLALWEVHPVTKIEVWDDARGGFVELPR